MYLFFPKSNLNKCILHYYFVMSIILLININKKFMNKLENNISRYELAQ